MKIAILYLSLPIGGAENMVVSYLRGLKKSNIDVIFIEYFYTNSFYSDELKKNGVPIFNLSKISGYSFLKRFIRKIDLFLFGRKRFRKIIKDNNIDIIHFNAYSNFLDDYIIKNNKKIFSFHAEMNREIEMIGSKRNNILKKLSFLGLNFFALTHEMYTDLKKYYNTDNVYLLNNGVDFKKNITSKFTKDDLCQELNVSSNSKFIVTVGRLHKVKNHERLIEIFDELHNIDKDYHLLIIGGNDDNRMQDLKLYVNQKKLEKYVHFLGVRSDVHNIVKLCDVFVLTSFSESFSLALVEAQSTGIRCVGSTGIPEEVFCNKNCIRVSLDSSNSEWIKAIVDESIVNLNSKDLNKYSEENMINQLILNYSMIYNKEK